MGKEGLDGLTTAPAPGGVVTHNLVAAGTVLDGAGVGEDELVGLAPQ
jgi:hypothetical protein